MDFDAAVVGAGAVGLACGYALSRRGLSVVVLEKEEAIGQGVSSRNSEVIHAGLYYPPGCLKARVCVEGRRLLYGFLEKHRVDFVRCGKLIVATEAGEPEALEKLAERARQNGVEGVRRVTGQEAREMEPELTCEEALWSPESGLFDSHGYMLALQGEIEAASGAVALRTPFEGAEPLQGGGFRVRTGGDEPASFTTGRLVIAAGLGAQAAARKIEGFPAERVPRQFLAKGVYFRLSGPAPFSRLIYPVPVHGSLGLHYRRDLGGQGVFGPDIRWVEEEEYEVEGVRLGRFREAIRRYWPGLADDALTPDYAGIRPKLHGADEPQPDFRVDGEEAHGLKGLVALFGIESPGLTSSLALGEEAASRLA